MMQGFRKIVRGRCEFGNGLFKKGQKHLLSHIQRRKPSISSQTMELAWQMEYDQSLNPNSSSAVQDFDVPAAAPCLFEEHEILKRNNLLLLSEIDWLQNICVRDFKLFIRHNTRDPPLIDMHRKIDKVTSNVSMTDVSEEISMSPQKLFGVPLRQGYRVPLTAVAEINEIMVNIKFWLSFESDC